MIRTGGFSKLSHVSVQTLRYYEEMGLLEPVAVDACTGYRLYEYSQLSMLHRTLDLLGIRISCLACLSASSWVRSNTSRSSLARLPRNK
jgi:DNA-binding transcriptional MerR regulator